MTKSVTESFTQLSQFRSLAGSPCRPVSFDFMARVVSDRLT